METKSNFKISPLKLLPAFFVFLIFGILFAININFITPAIVKNSGVSPFIGAQVSNTLIVFIPIFITALIFLKAEGIQINYANVKERFNIRKPVLKDFVWMFLSLIVAVIMIGLIVFLLHISPLAYDINDMKQVSPIELRPLQGIERLFVLFMPISFFFNYVGEEILWRGAIYPRQELLLGSKTWMINGILHGVFHLFMGWNVLVFLPLFLAISFVYYKTKNLTIVIIMHALLGAPTDFLLAIGILT